MSIPFWYNDPYILLNKKDIYSIWPSSCMEYNERMNAITRLVIILAIVGYILTKSKLLVASSFFTIVGLVVVYKNNRSKHDKKLLSNIGKEGFTNNENFQEMKENFEVPTTKNPLQNLNATVNNTGKKSAPPSFNPDVNEKINESAKEQIKELHADFPDIDKKLFRDLGEQENFDNSMRPFYSMPNTRLPNDQKSFTDFCYGDMKSGKEHNEFLNESKF